VNPIPVGRRVVPPRKGTLHSARQFACILGISLSLVGFTMVTSAATAAGPQHGAQPAASIHVPKTYRGQNGPCYLGLGDSITTGFRVSTFTNSPRFPSLFLRTLKTHRASGCSTFVVLACRLPHGTRHRRRWPGHEHSLDPVQQLRTQPSASSSDSRAGDSEVGLGTQLSGELIYHLGPVSDRADDRGPNDERN
jgi:hypothetical protein